MEERFICTGLGKQWLNQFQIADGNRIELQMFSAFVETDAVDMSRLDALRVAHIMQNGSGGDGCCRMLCKAKAVEGSGSQLAVQQGYSIVAREYPIFKRCFRPNAVKHRWQFWLLRQQRIRAGEEHLAGRGLLSLIEAQRPCP